VNREEILASLERKINISVRTIHMDHEMAKQIITMLKEPAFPRALDKGLADVILQVRGSTQWEDSSSVHAAILKHLMPAPKTMFVFYLTFVNISGTRTPIIFRHKTKAGAENNRGAALRDQNTYMNISEISEVEITPGNEPSYS
jgi:hypothetical protein